MVTWYTLTSDLFEVCCRLDLPDRLHQSIPHNDANVCSRVAVGFMRQLPQVRLTQAVGRVAQVETEHLGPGRFLGQRNVDALLKSEHEKEEDVHF